jgi:hypothetical protein
MQRVLFPDSVCPGAEEGKDMTALFLSMPVSSSVQKGPKCFDDCESVFSKHRIRKIELAAQDDRSTTGIRSQSSTRQLLNSEVALLQATIQNKEMYLVNARQEMHELRLKMQQQNTENLLLKKQLNEMKEAAAVIAERHAIEMQSYLAKVMDAEERTLEAASAMNLATNVHKAATSAHRAVSSVRFENSAIKRDKDRLIHLLSLFEPAKALTSLLKRIPSNYFPLPGIGTTAISKITKAQQTSTSSFVNPLISRKLATESSFWMSSRIADIVMGWGAENSLDESVLVQLVIQLNKLWTDATKRAQELHSVTRLKQNRTISVSSLNESRNPSISKMEKKSKKNIQSADFLCSSKPLLQHDACDSVKCLKSLGKLLESEVSRLRMKAQIEDEDGLMNAETKHHPDSLCTPQTVEVHHIVSPSRIQRSCKSEESSIELQEISTLDLLESLRQELMVMEDLPAETCSLISPQTFSHIEPLQKGVGELVLRNTSFRISLLRE